MFTQLSLFDSAVSIDTVPGTASFVHVPPTHCLSTEQANTSARQGSGTEPCQRAEQPYGLQRTAVADERGNDEIRPMGELAQLVLARYDLLARRRQEMDRRRREQPRKSIRVLSPQRRVAR